MFYTQWSGTVTSSWFRNIELGPLSVCCHFSFILEDSPVSISRLLSLLYQAISLVPVPHQPLAMSQLELSLYSWHSSVVVTSCKYTLSKYQYHRVVLVHGFFTMHTNKYYLENQVSFSSRGPISVSYTTTQILKVRTQVFDSPSFHSWVWQFGDFFWLLKVMFSRHNALMNAKLDEYSFFFFCVPAISLGFIV